MRLSLATIVAAALALVTAPPASANNVSICARWALKRLSSPPARIVPEP